jgi:hypothetical protein
MPLMTPVDDHFLLELGEHAQQLDDHQHDRSGGVLLVRAVRLP